MKARTKTLRRKHADANHDVVSVVSSSANYMKKPCPDCPWRKDAIGSFPAEAFRISAHTSYDMAESTFGCHSSGTDNAKTCAGFLLKGARHSLAVRLGFVRGDYSEDISDGGVELFDSYKEMAIANGVDPEDECLSLSRTD